MKECETFITPAILSKWFSIRRLQVVDWYDMNAVSKKKEYTEVEREKEMIVF